MLICSPAYDAMRMMQDEHVDLIYTDPPFGTQNNQVMSRKKSGVEVSRVQYSDHHDDYQEFLRKHLAEFHRLLKPSGTLYLHLDYRWSHYAKVMLDEIFGRDSFLNEIIWAYDFGGRGKRSWPKKHDTILVYVKDPKKYVFNWDDIDRIPYETPELQYVGRTREEAEKRIAQGKVPTDVWFMSIVGTNSKERVGYPNQKPVKLIERIIKASSNPGDRVLDPFAGSGSTGVAAVNTGRKFTLIDNNPVAIEHMKSRLKGVLSEESV